MRKSWQVEVSRLVLTAALAFSSGCGPGGPVPVSATAAAGDEVYEIVVPDIVCASCAASIRRKLEKVEGVVQIVIDLENKTLEVGVDAAAHPSDAALRDAISAAGFLKPTDGTPGAG